MTVTNSTKRALKKIAVFWHAGIEFKFQENFTLIASERTKLSYLLIFVLRYHAPSVLICSPVSDTSGCRLMGSIVFRSATEQRQPNEREHKTHWNKDEWQPTQHRNFGTKLHISLHIRGSIGVHD